MMPRSVNPSFVFARRAASIALVALTFLPPLSLVGGCGSLARHAVPMDLVDAAQVPGMPDVRFWGDGEDPKVEAAYVRTIELERQALGLPPGEALPDSNFLALSGGGSNGAFGAGLLCGWSERGDRPTFKIVTGISTGALIAPFAFLGSEYDDKLRDVYTTVRTEDVAKMRGFLRGLMSDAMSDNTPLRHLVEKYVTQDVLDMVAAEAAKGRILIIGTTNMDTQRPVVWSMGRIARSGHPDSLKLFQDILIASAAIPGAFPPVMIEVEANGKHYDEMHCDGGVSSQVFLYPASFSIENIDDKFNIDRERHVYVIRNAQLASSYKAVERRLLPISGRAIDTLIKTQGIGDLYRIYLGCERDGLDYKLAYIPPDFSAESKEAFDPEYMTQLFNVGFELGRKGYPWASAPPGFAPPKAGRPESPANSAR